MVVRKATRSDAGTIADVFASAFDDDPLFRWMTGSRGGAGKRSRPFFASLVRTNLSKADHEVYVDDTGDCAAIWLGVDRWRVSIGDLIRETPASARTFRWHGPRALRVLSRMEQAHPTEPHYYLQYLGTRAGRQGKGLGAALMRPMVERCDEEGLPAYLESSERAVSFYARHGFVPRGHVDRPKGCPSITPMWREPR